MLAEIACFVNRLVSRYCSNTPQIQGKSPPLKNVKDGAPQNSKSEAGPPALQPILMQMEMNIRYDLAIQRQADKQQTLRLLAPINQLSRLTLAQESDS
jgi:hypothetical protein